MKYSLVLPISLLFAVAAVAQNNARPSVKASFCGLVPSQSMQQANATFNEMFRIKIQKLGEPIVVQRVLGKYIDIVDFSRCAETWEFKNINPGSGILVLMSWKHGEGWRPMQISTKGFRTTIPWPESHRYSN